MIIYLSNHQTENHIIKYSDNIIKPMTIEPVIPDIQIEPVIPNEHMEAIIPNEPIDPILNDMPIEAIIQNEHIDIIKPIKPKAHAINDEDWDRYSSEERRKIQEQNDAEWDEYDKKMEQYIAIMKLNKRPNRNNNHMFKNLDKDIIIDDNKDVVFLASENANLQWLRTWPASSIIWPATNRNGYVKKKEELVNMFEPRPTSIWCNETNEQKLVEWLKTQHGSFITTQTGIAIEYLEACQIYCEKDNERQIQLNTNKNETKVLVSKILASKPDNKCAALERYKAKYHYIKSYTQKQ